MSAKITKDTRYTLNNGAKIPVAGFGLYETGPQETEDITYEALKAGYRHIDSAIIYGNEQEAINGIAKYLKEFPAVKRSEIWFTTKIWHEQHGYEGTKKAIQESLAKAAAIDYIDLFLIHSPISNKEKRLGTWKALQEAVAEGKVKTIGVSNFGVKHLEELLAWDGLTITPAVNQVELQPWLPRLDLQNYGKKHGILLEAYSPMTQGKKLNDPELIALAGKYNFTPAQVLLKWSFDQGFIALAKTVKVERLKQNLAVLEEVTLPEEIVKAFHNPDSYQVLTWDPTVYEDPK